VYWTRKNETENAEFSKKPRENKSEAGAQLKAHLTAPCEFPYAMRLRNPVSKTGGFSAESIVRTDPFKDCPLHQIPKTDAGANGAPVGF
jgi:hypothetical protein